MQPISVERLYLISALSDRSAADLFVEAKSKRLSALYAHYGLLEGDRGAAYELLLSLAEEWVPGFRANSKVARRGAPVRWTTKERGLLVALVRALETTHKLNSSKACRELARLARKMPEIKDLILARCSATTLLRQYTASKKRPEVLEWIEELVSSDGRTFRK